MNTDKSNTQHSFRTAEAQSLFGQLSDFGIDAGQIGFVCVIGNKTLQAILTSVALFTCTTFTTFDNIV